MSVRDVQPMKAPDSIVVIPEGNVMDERDVHTIKHRTKNKVITEGF